MIARIMVDEVKTGSADDAERHIKIFLNRFEEWDENMRDVAAGQQGKESKKASWVLKSNFVCLPNVPGTMQSLGAPRFTFEGRPMGEGIIRYLKKHSVGRRKGFARNLMKKFYERRSFKQITKTLTKGSEEDVISDFESNDEEDEDEEGTVNHEFTDLLKLCRDQVEARTKFQKCVPLSVVAFDKDKFGIAVRHTQENKDNKEKFLCLPIETVEFKEDCFGAACFKWKLSASENEPLPEVTMNNINHFCILLPKLTETGLPKENDDVATKNVYYMITSEWKELLNDKTAGLPRASDAKC